MLRLSIGVVVKEYNEKYIDYLHTISPYFDEILLITERESYEVTIENAVVRQVVEPTLNSINDIISDIKGDWLLWLHEGEQIDSKDVYRLRDWLYAMKGSIGLTQVITPRDKAAGQFKNCDAAVPRLLKKGNTFSYYSPYAELLDYSQITELTDIALCGIKIYGAREQLFLGINEKAQQKSFQELEQLVTEAGSPMGFYQFGYECYRYQKFKRSVQAINQAIFLLAAKHEIPSDYFYKLKYASLVEMKQDEETLKGLKLILQLYPTHTELIFYCALLNYKMNEYKQSRQDLFACLTNGEQDNRLCRKGAGSYLASFYIGLCYEQEGDSKLATHYYQNALIVNPTYKAANRALQKLNIAISELKT